MSEKRKITKGVVHEHVCLKAFNSWHIGGKAERLYWPIDLADLQRFLTTLPSDEPITWLGLGSNVLIRDGGIKGTVIITQGALSALTMLPGARLYAQAGVSCAQAARFAARHDAVNGEFLAGIPGTMGGALLMNAGAFGGETWPVVVQVETMNRQGEIEQRLPESFEIAYRHTAGLAQDEWFVSATLQLAEGDGKASLAKIKNLLAKRAETQPTGEPSCGSVFQNPPGDFAARLIESLALKGHRVGGIEVSPKHANFMINCADASATDTEQLIQHVQHRVREAYGITLQPEVKFVGEPV